MLTPKQIATVVGFKRSYGLSDEGTCFGVTDPSRLRPLFRQPISSRHICASCHQGRHECAKTVQLYSFDPQGKPAVKKTGAIPCECYRCNVAEQPAKDVTEAEPF
ncbi:MAG: hypothetical protein KW788_05295 [Candidatus Doudnabacteria bacterium]|nr:hypothetical protein [Candidatus Doudnabacteria bacterium]